MRSGWIVDVGSVRLRYPSDEGVAPMIAWICGRLDHLPWDRARYEGLPYRCLCGAVYNVSAASGTVTTSGPINVIFR